LNSADFWNAPLFLGFWETQALSLKGFGAFKMGRPPIMGWDIWGAYLQCLDKVNPMEQVMV